jgi:hypothetical protein
MYRARQTSQVLSGVFVLQRLILLRHVTENRESVVHFFGEGIDIVEHPGDHLDQRRDIFEIDVGIEQRLELGADDADVLVDRLYSIGDAVMYQTCPLR